MIYLDNASTTRRKPLCVTGALMYNSIANSINAGRGSHRYSLKGAELLNSAADSIASLFNIDEPERLAFTQNATYALNLAILGVLSGGGHAIVTSMEHNSVLRPVHSLGNYTVVRASGEGYVKPEDIEAAILPDTRLIICTHASNVCGSIQPISEIGAIARKHNILFLADAAQSAGIIDIDVNRMNIDLLAFSGHKGLMGPLGTGCLYVGKRARLSPIITGGTGSASENLLQPDFLPDMLHSGTLNTPAIAALGRAADFVRSIGTENLLEHECALAFELISRLKSIDGVTVLGSSDTKQRNGTVAFTIDKISSGAAASLLDAKFNIAVRGGWHCAYTAHKTLGSASGGAIRASFGYYNRTRDAVKLADAVSKISKSV